eukprot:14873514-Heterocapsa_arctica.AAC.1
MEIAYFAEKQMPGLTTCGGNVERSTDTRILAILNSCKSNTESTTNHNVSGMPEQSRHIGPLYQTRDT